MNLKLLICLSVCVCLCFPAFAQDMNWYQRITYTNKISLNGLNADTSGNLYLSVFFRGNCDFDPGPSEYRLNSGIWNHLYVEKLRPDGSFLWARNWGSALLDTTFMSVGFDKYGNTYLEGRFADSIDLDPGSGEYWMKSAAPNNAFLLKLDQEGQFMWAVQLPFLTTAPVADEEGNIWLTANFNGDIDADPGPGVFILNGLIPVSNSNTAFIKLDSAGNFIWAGTIQNVRPLATALDPQGNLYLRGILSSGKIDADPGPGVINLSYSGVGHNHMNLKLDKTGAFVWVAHTARGTVSHSALYFGGMEVDDRGQVYMSTQIIGKYDVDPGPGELLLDAKLNDILVMKLDASGNLAWANHLKNPSLETALDLKLDAEGNSYITGYLNKDADMDPGPAVVLSPNNRGGGNDAYLLKFDSTGAFKWASRYGGKSGEYGEYLAVDGKGRVTVGGPSGDIMDFGNLPGEDFLPTTNGKGSFFLAQVNQDDHYSGTVFHDLNHNQVRDSGEVGVPNMVLCAGNQHFTSTNTNGHYRFTADISDDTLRVGKLRPYWQFEPNFALPDSFNLVHDFAFTQPDTVKDVALKVVYANAFRPGFKTSVWIEVQNLGNTLLDSVWVSIDSFAQDVALGVANCSPLPQIQNAKRLSWRIDQLQPAAHVQIRALFHTPDTTDLGTPIHFPITAALPGDLDTTNNYHRLQARVRGAFDPNDKRVTPEVLAESKLDFATLQYLIRFQNTGNLPAEFVILRDSLPASLDLGSLEILGASHAFTWRLRDAGILEIHFNKINLPDSLSDPEGSQGFAAFRIRPLRNLQAGDSIVNRAGIYFDYNPPIITPIAVTALTKTNAIPTIPNTLNTLSFSLLPNPASALSPVMLSLPTAHQGGLVQVGDLSGRTILQQGIPAHAHHIQLPGLPRGWFTVQVQIGTERGTRLLLVE